MPKVLRKDFPQFTNEVGQLEKLFKALPQLAGNMALNFFDDSWERKGFVDKKRERWKPVQDRKTGQIKKRPLVGSGRLRRSLRMRVSGNTIIIFTDVPYAKIHNEGGTIEGDVTVRKHKRKTPSGKTTTVSEHTRKVKIKIPKRQFMGHSQVLEKRIVAHVTHSLDQIFT